MEKLDLSIFKKRKLTFPDDRRDMLIPLANDDLAEIDMIDEAGNPIKIKFKVIRHDYLGSYQLWVYGKLLNDMGDKAYRRLEIRLHKGHPEWDTAEYFIMEPPLREE